MPGMWPTFDGFLVTLGRGGRLQNDPEAEELRLEGMHPGRPTVRSQVHAGDRLAVERAAAPLGPVPLAQPGTPPLGSHVDTSRTSRFQGNSSPQDPPLFRTSRTQDRSCSQAWVTGT